MNIHNLISACKRNDAKAQMQLYDNYVKAMYTIALRYVKHTAIAEDIVQESFIKAFHKLTTFREEVSFGAWLKRIVINQSIDYLKKKKLDIVAIDDNIIHLIEEPITWEVNSNVTIKKIKTCLETLPAKYKIVLQLFLLEGYDHQEISEILSISEVSSRTQLMRGKNKLKLLLEANDKVINF